MRDRTLWTWHVAAGVVILVLLGLHMAIMHLDQTLGLFGTPGAEPVEWESVAARAGSLFFHRHLRPPARGGAATTACTACATSCSS